MMKRLSLLLAALFVGATLFAAPVIASGNSDNKNNNDKVCVLRHNNDNGKDYRWVWDVEDLHVGDKVVKDKYCEHNDNNAEHKNNSDNNNGDDNGNANNNDDNGHANNMNAHS